MPFDECNATVSDFGEDGVPPREVTVTMYAEQKSYTVRIDVAPGDTALMDMGPGRMVVNFGFATHKVSVRGGLGLGGHGGLREDGSYLTGHGGMEFGYRLQGAEPYMPDLSQPAPTGQ